MKTNTLTFLILSVLVLPSFAKDWPHFRGPDRNGVVDATFKPVTDDVEIVWKVNVGGGGGGKCSVVIAAGRLYTHGRNAQRDSLLRCLDAATGDEIWSTKTNWTNSTPSVEKGRVYQMDGDRFVYCFDAKSGDEIWKSEQLPDSTERREWGHSGSPVLWEDLVIVNIGHGAALNKATGKIVWQKDGFSGMATPVLFEHKGKPAVAIFVGEELLALNPHTGARLWSIPWKSNHGVNAPDPIFLDGGRKVYVGSDYGKGRALYDLSGGEPKQLWYHGPESDGGAHAYASSLLKDGTLYCFTRGAFGPLDLATGKRKWEASIGVGGIFVGDKLVSVGSNGEMVIGAPTVARFNHIGKFQVAKKQVWNVPAYSDGKLFVRNDKGDVSCVRIAQ